MVECTPEGYHIVVAFLTVIAFVVGLVIGKMRKRG